MKILFVLSSMRFGGAERVVSILSGEFSRRGDTVDIFVTSGQRESAYSLPDDVTISARTDAKADEAGIRFFCGTLRGIRRHVRKSRPDVVIAFMTWQIIYTVLALTGMKIPLIISERNDPATIDGKEGSPAVFRVRNYCYEKADGAVFQTDGARRCFSQKRAARSCVIMNPLDISILPEPYKGKRDGRIVSVGRLSAQKNHALLLRAFALIRDEFPDVRVCIYGEGEKRGELLTLAEELGLSDRLDLPGNVSDVPQRIREASVFAFTSDYEGLPNALMEAMALGIPCVATDCTPGGAAALIRDGENGALVPCGDAAAFSEALHHILSDEEAAAKLGDEAARVREKFNEKIITDQWCDYIDRTVKERRR